MRKRKAVLKGHSGTVYTLSQASDPKYLFSGGYDNKVIRWNLETCAAVDVFKGFSSYLSAMTVSNDGQFLFSVNAKTSNFIR